MPAETLSVRAILDTARVASLVVATPYVDRNELVSRLASSHALLEGHFRLLSGLHSDVFLRFRNFVEDGDNLEWAAHALATALRQRGQRFDSIVCPDSAGSLLASQIAESFGRVDRVLTLRTNAANEPTEVFAAASTRASDRVLLINDILTTGNGVRTMRRAVENTGAQVTGLGLFASRVPDPVTVLGTPPFAVTWLFNLDVVQAQLTQCHQCQAGANAIVEARELN